MCDTIALLNKSEKILDGTVKDIRKTYRTNTFKIAFKGNVLGFTNALWTGGEITERHTEEEIHTFTVKLVPNFSSSHFLQAILPTCELVSFNEIIPSMNDIFIRKVNEGNEALGTKSNFTE